MTGRKIGFYFLALGMVIFTLGGCGGSSTSDAPTSGGLETRIGTVGERTVELGGEKPKPEKKQMKGKGDR